MGDFEKSILYVLKNEGGLEINPHDTGGTTNFGITQETLDKFSPGSSVSIMTIETAKLVYKKFFWDTLKLDLIPQAISTAILDTAVNEGQIPAIRFAQECCGIYPDGLIGPKTIEALQKKDETEFVLEFVGHICDRYSDIVKNAPSQAEFLKGWLRRALRLFTLINKKENT